MKIRPLISTDRGAFSNKCLPKIGILLAVVEKLFLSAFPSFPHALRSPAHPTSTCPPTRSPRARPRPRSVAAPSSPPSGAPRAPPRRARPPRAGAARSPSTPMSDSTSCSSARSARPSPRPAASETSWPRCPRCVRVFPVSNRIDARPSRADARESASRSVSPQRQKCQLSGRSPDSQHDERHSGNRHSRNRAFAFPRARRRRRRL